MEDRFLRYKNLKLNQLKIYLPEATDLILMKVTRLLGKDREDIAHLIKNNRIPDGMLLKRFRGEMDHIVGDQHTLKSHYLLVIEDNYGKKVADKHERRII